MNIQPRLRNPRESLPSCVAKEIKAAINRDATRWNCSRSWIVATALAAFYDINIIRPYELKKKKKVA